MNQLVLASRSQTRQRLLTSAGVAFDVLPVQIDETSVKQSARQDGLDVTATALLLAELKAVQRIGCDDHLVLGADQILECDGAWFDKPADRAEARKHLLTLRGRTHRLVTAAVIIQGGARVWQHVDVPVVTIRAFSDRFLDWYLDTMGAGVLGSVGAYQVEGLGLQLMAEVRGDMFSIMGLPLLPLLDFLRERGVVPA